MVAAAAVVVVCFIFFCYFLLMTETERIAKLKHYICYDIVCVYGNRILMILKSEFSALLPCAQTYKTYIFVFTVVKSAIIIAICTPIFSQ